MDDVIGAAAADLQAKPQILADDAEAEAGQRAEKQSRQDDGGVTGYRDIAAQFGYDHQNAGGDGEHQRNGSGPKQQLDREIREVENAVQAIAQLLTDCPCALTFEPPLAFVDNVLAAIAEPEQEGDQVGIDTLKLEQVVAHLAGASEHIDAAARHVLDHEFAVEEPEDIGCDFGKPGVRPPAANSENDIGPAGVENLEELEYQFRRLLKIGRHHGHAVAARALEASRDGGEGAEIPAEREQLGAQRQRRQSLAQDLQAAVGAAIHHEDHFELPRNAAREFHQFGEQTIQVRLVPVNRDDQGVHLT